MADETPTGSLRLVVVTHESRLLEATCSSISLPARRGYITILPGHTALISLLAIGELTFQEGSESRSVAMAGGFFEISDGVVTVLAEAAELADQIDVEQAKSDLEEARASLSNVAGQQLTEARHRIEHAEARLRVAGA